MKWIKLVLWNSPLLNMVLEPTHRTHQPCLGEYLLRIFLQVPTLQSSLQNNLAITVDQAHFTLVLHLNKSQFQTQAKFKNSDLGGKSVPLESDRVIHRPNKPCREALLYWDLANSDPFVPMRLDRLRLRLSRTQWDLLANSLLKRGLGPQLNSVRTNSVSA